MCRVEVVVGKVVAAGTVLAIVLAVLWLANDVLFEASLTLIRRYANEWDTSSFAAFMRFYTTAGIVLVAAAALTYAMLFGPKIKQILFVDAIFLTIGLIYFLKTVHNANRPNWVDDNIPVRVAERSYGHPSGHAATAAAFALAGLYLYWNSNADLALTAEEE